MIIHLLAPKDKSKWSPIWHHCYKIFNNLPYEIKLWNDKEIDNLLKEDDLEFFNLIDQLPKIYKLDYVRPVIIKKFGGAYFDMDIELFINFLPTILSDRIYIMGNVQRDNGPTYLENSILIDNSNFQFNYFWKDLQEYFKYNIKYNLEKCKEPYSSIIKNWNTLKYVGPEALSRFVKAHEYLYPIVEVLDFKYFNGSSNSIRFSTHHQTHVWRP